MPAIIIQNVHILVNTYALIADIAHYLPKSLELRLFLVSLKICMRRDFKQVLCYINIRQNINNLFICKRFNI